jgi:hypothetical protein
MLAEAFINEEVVIIGEGALKAAGDKKMFQEMDPKA